MRSLYEAHRLKEQLNATYHNVMAGADEGYTDALPDNRDAYPTAVGTLLDCVRAHISNMSKAGVATAYHASIDTTLAAIATGKPSSFEEAVKYHEMLNWILATHAAKGSPVHDYAHAGGMRPTVRGIEAVHHAYRTELLSAAATVPPNEVYASGKLIMLGGFKKG